MSDALDTLSDDALSGAFARDGLGRAIDGGMMRMADEKCGGIGFESWCAIPPFATSADAVLPLLEKLVRVHIEWNRAGGYWFVQIPSGHIGTAPTFARAACIALIRAKRAEKGRS